MFKNDSFNVFQSEFTKLIGKSGVIHFQNTVDYLLPVKKYLSIEVSEAYDDGEPMIFMIKFINEAGRQDVIEFWEDTIQEVEFSEPEDVLTDKSFAFAIVSDDDNNYIEFYFE